MKAAKPGIVWQWQCDRCYRYYGPKAADQSDLPTYEQMIAGGWSIGMTYGDLCPSCIANGATPNSERHPAHACTCPSGDGSLRWPCPTHPPTTPEPDDHGRED